jgi:hypothetical protein
MREEKAAATQRARERGKTEEETMQTYLGDLATLAVWTKSARFSA